MALKYGIIIIDCHALLFAEIMHPYLPKLYILICRSGTSLIAIFYALLIADYTLLIRIIIALMQMVISSSILTIGTMEITL